MRLAGPKLYSTLHLEPLGRSRLAFNLHPALEGTPSVRLARRLRGPVCGARVSNQRNKPAARLSQPANRQSKSSVLTIHSSTNPLERVQTCQSRSDRKRWRKPTRQRSKSGDCNLARSASGHCGCARRVVIRLCGSLLVRLTWWRLAFLIGQSARLRWELHDSLAASTSACLLGTSTT